MPSNRIKSTEIVEGQRSNRNELVASVRRCIACRNRLFVGKNWYPSTAARQHNICSKCLQRRVQVRRERIIKDKHVRTKNSGAEPALSIAFTITRNPVVTIHCKECGRVAAEFQSHDVHDMLEKMLEGERP